MKLLIAAEAEVEIESARQYLNQTAPKLGERFLDELSDTLDQIRLAPDSFPLLETLPVKHSYRRALLKPFRYALIFEIHEDTLLVVALTHTSRRPNYWLSRRKPF